MIKQKKHQFFPVRKKNGVKDVAVEGIKKVGVIGSGLMGNGIAQVVATAGYHTIFCDVSKEIVNRGYESIKTRLEKAVGKGKMSEQEKEEILARFVCTDDYKDLAEVDFIFEAVFENMDVKKELYAKIDSICKDTCIFASNTSGLSITEIASATKRSDKVVGTHFFNPVPVMKLVELIRGYETSDVTYGVAKELCEDIGKTTITVNEAPLFCVNRILIPMLNEAMFVLSEGIATREDIDTGMVLGTNQPIGPLALSDLIGLDTLLMVMETLYNETADSKYRPCAILKKMVRAGKYGRKSGEGFYKYE